MTLIVNTTPAHTTADGKSFNVRSDAVAHAKNLQRLTNLSVIEGIDTELSEFLVANADAIVDALTVKQTRTKKVAA